MFSQLSCNSGVVTHTYQDTVWNTAGQIVANSLSNGPGLRVFKNSCDTRILNLDEDYVSTIGNVAKNAVTYSASATNVYNDDFPEPVYTPLLEPCNALPPPVVAAPELGQTCSANSPNANVAGSVNVLSGNEHHAETDVTLGSVLSFRRSYNSQANHRGTMGPKWQHNFERKLLIDATTALILRPDGRVLEFTDTGGSWSSTMEAVETLESISSPPIDGYRYTTANGAIELYDSQGQWHSTTTPNGLKIEARYNTNGELTKVKDAFGNEITFTYSVPDGKLETVNVPGNVLPGTLAYTYTYNSDDMLESVTPPGSTGDRTYIYNEDAYPQTLNGITDENDDRLMTWTYDAHARVVTEYSGDDDTAVAFVNKANNHTFAYDTTQQQTTVTNSLGKDTVYHYTGIGGAKKITRVEGAVAAHCAAANQDYTHDPGTGLVHTQTDWRGNVTEYTYNSRGLENTRIEARGSSVERTIATDWHATLNRPVVITEAGRTTSFTYNAGGQLTAKTLTDTSGQGSAPRSWTYTYTNGQLATIDGPLPGTVDVETFDYQGNGFLWKRTNALGHVTEVLSHNGQGLPTRIKDPNGAELELEYSDRGWLEASRRQVGAHTLTTQYGYDAVGQLTGLTLPSGMHYTYGYDTAGRLGSIQNSKGETMTYTLDAAGNRTGEVITYSGGGTAYTTSRQFDELSRMIEALDHTLAAHQYQYDDNGNVTREIDRKGYPLDRLFDGLDRLRQIDFADNGAAYYAYNALDHVTSVTDQANHTTTYVYDGLGNQVSRSSPDTGTTTYEYDAAGNRKKKVDANGVVTLYDYDALGRLTQVSYPANAALNASYTYDGTVYSYGIGRLSTISDNTGTMALFHDQMGRVSAKYTAIQGVTYLINYTYDAAGNLAEIKMPDGRRIDYSYDSAGEVTAVSTRQTAASTPVVLANNFSVLPFGPIKGWTFGNAVVHAVSYDEGYRVETVLDQGSASILDLDYSYDANHNIDGLANGVNSALSQSFSFDERDRLDTASGAYGAYDYDYDLAGNRTQFTRAGYSETFTLSPGSHRLDSISVDDNGVTSQRTLSYDNAGNTTADSRGYSYGYGQNNRLILAGGPHGGAWLLTNAQGQRVITQPTSAGIAPRHYLYDAAGELVMESHGVTGEVLKHYIRMGGQLLAILSQGRNATGQPTAASLYYVHSDHLGTPQALTDQSGQVVWSIAYDPFGQATVNEDQDGDGTSIEFNLRFPGQYYDKYSGVNYNYFRDYDPSLGRFVQSDPIGLRGGLNTYAYVNSNPLIYIDPTGEFGLPGAGVGVIVGVYGAYLQNGECTDLTDLFIGAAAGAASGFVGGSIGAAVAAIGGATGSGLGAIAGASAGLAGSYGGQVASGGVGSINHAAAIGSSVGGAYSGAYAAVGGGIVGDAIGGIIGLAGSAVGSKVGSTVDESLGRDSGETVCGCE
jgi:RHS repeat-associated protein